MELNAQWALAVYHVLKDQIHESFVKLSHKKRQAPIQSTSWIIKNTIAIQILWFVEKSQKLTEGAAMCKKKYTLAEIDMAENLSQFKNKR